MKDALPGPQPPNLKLRLRLRLRRVFFYENDTDKIRFRRIILARCVRIDAEKTLKCFFAVFPLKKSTFF